MLLRRISICFAAAALAVASISVGCNKSRPGIESENGSTGEPHTSSEPRFSKEELAILGTHVSPTISSGFTFDGNWIIVSGTDGVTIHDADSMECVHWLNGNLIEVSPSKPSFLIKHANGERQLRSIPDGRLLWQLPRDIGSGPIHFTDDGQYLVCGYRSLLRIETREIVYRLPVSYSFDPLQGGDQYRNPSGNLRRVAETEDPANAELDTIPFLYRHPLRHDARPLITPKSGSCSPAGRFMIVQTGEEDTSYEPYFSFIDRRNGRRLFTDVASSEALFFHDDEFVFRERSVYQTEDAKVLFTLDEGITAAALNTDETMLAVGWENGQLATLDPISGSEVFRLQIEKSLDDQTQQSGPIVSLAFSNESKRLAAVGRKLTLIDVPAQRISQALHLGSGSRAVAKPETTSPAEISFNTDGSRLLLKGVQGDEYIYSRAKLHVLQTTNLDRRRALVSPVYFDRSQNIPPVYFSPDARWAIVVKDGRGSRADQLELWKTTDNEPFAEIPRAAFDWHYRRRFVSPDAPKQHLGLGRFRRWHADRLILDPWSIEAIESKNEKSLPEDAKTWLRSFVRLNPQSTTRGINGRTLDLRSKQWRLKFVGNQIRQLFNLSTGEVYPEDSVSITNAERQTSHESAKQRTCWGLKNVEAIAFSPDGSRLLVYRRNYAEQDEHLLALFEMPSGELIREYEGHAHLGRIHIAPNNRLAAISTDFYRKTWIIDLQTGETLLDLPGGGKCVFSPDSQSLQIGDRYGKSLSLLPLATGKRVDFSWASRWAFSPGGRFAVGGSMGNWFFVELSTGERLPIPGEIHQTGMQTLSTTALELPSQGNRLLSVHNGTAILFDVNSARPLVRFDPSTVARDAASHAEKRPDTYSSITQTRFLYTPDRENFVYVIQGRGEADESSRSEDQPTSGHDQLGHSTQVLIGDLATGSQIECSVPNWSQSSPQHLLFTPDGARLVAISADKMVCWNLDPLGLAWESELHSRWTDPEMESPSVSEDTPEWSLGYMIHPNNDSILIAADGRQAILFSLATGKEEQRFGPLPINPVLRFGADGRYLQVSYRANRSMRLYETSTGKPVRTYHFTAEGKEQVESKTKKQTTEEPAATDGPGPVTTPQPVAGQSPVRRFDLSHWKLTLPTNREGAYEGHPMEVPAEKLVGEFKDPHFYSSPDGAMLFWCPVIGTTTEGTKFPRSELREMLEPGNPRKNWKLAGSHVMEARCRVIEVPSNPKVVIGQIHGYAGNGKAPPLVKLQYFKGRVEALVKQSPVEGKDKKLTYPGIQLGDDISWKIEVNNGELAVTVNGTTQRENMIEHDPRWADQTFYFKAGCYPQDNQGDETEGGRISFSRLIVRHQGE